MYRAPKIRLDLTGQTAEQIEKSAEQAFAEQGTQGFVLTTDSDLKSLCLRFLARHNRKFTWSPLALGPDVWRVEIARREFADDPETLEDFLGLDHERLHSLLNRLLSAVKQKTEEITEAYEQFEFALLRHFAIEQELLFPEFNFVAHLKYGPLAEVLTEQHEVIVRTLAKLRPLVLALTADPPASDAEEMIYLGEHIRLTLDPHFEKEETSLLPISDEMLPVEKKLHLLSAMKLWSPGPEFGLEET